MGEPCDCLLFLCQMTVFFPERSIQRSPISFYWEMRGKVSNIRTALPHILPQSCLPAEKWQQQGRGMAFTVMNGTSCIMSLAVEDYICTVMRAQAEWRPAAYLTRLIFSVTQWTSEMYLFDQKSVRMFQVFLNWTFSESTVVLKH